MLDRRVGSQDRKNVAEGKMVKRIMEEKKEEERRPGEKEKWGEKERMWAIVTISLCSRRD